MLKESLLMQILRKIYKVGEVLKIKKGPSVTINSTKYKSYTIQLNMGEVDEAKLVIIPEEHKVMVFYIGVLVEYTFDTSYEQIVKQIIAKQDDKKGELYRGTFGRYHLIDKSMQRV